MTTPARIFLVAMLTAGLSRLEPLVLGAPSAPKEEVERLRGRASSGDAKAQFKLGMKYFNGDGLRRDYGEAHAWLGKAAAQGLAEAKDNIGVLYAGGLGVPRDYAQAMKWYRAAAAQGLASAAVNVGGLYYRGDGVPQSYAEARKWYQAAARRGFAGGFRNLGFMHYRGDGMPADPVEAYKWFHLGAAAGDEVSRANAAVLEKSLSPRQIQEALRRGRSSPRAAPGIDASPSD